jgi:transcriptional regulator with XRE-family HTH domain
VITKFGKRVRQYRIQIDALMADMAKALECSPAYLSAVELGKKPLSDDLVSKIIAYFHSHGCIADDLWKLADETKREVIVNVDGFDPEAKQAVAAFARKVQSWSPQKMDLFRNFTEDD